LGSDKPNIFFTKTFSVKNNPATIDGAIIHVPPSPPFLGNAPQPLNGNALGSTNKGENRLKPWVAHAATTAGPLPVAAIETAFSSNPEPEEPVRFVGCPFVLVPTMIKYDSWVGGRVRLSNIGVSKQGSVKKSKHLFRNGTSLFANAIVSWKMFGPFMKSQSFSIKRNGKPDVLAATALA
jgi:hypothetical protein